MSEDKMILHCSPTLRGIKAGSIFTASYTSKNEFEKDVERANLKFNKTQIRFSALKYSKGKGIVYVYRPSLLLKDISKPESIDVLSTNGYKSYDCKSCIDRLIERLYNSSEFPHEIGLFLGYPPEDVKGFIENQAKKFKYADYWKVYGDVERAKIRFNAFRRSTKFCYSKWKAGASIIALVN